MIVPENIFEIEPDERLVAANREAASFQLYRRLKKLGEDPLWDQAPPAMSEAALLIAFGLETGTTHVICNCTSRDLLRDMAYTMMWNPGQVTCRQHLDLLRVPDDPLELLTCSVCAEYVPTGLRQIWLPVFGVIIAGFVCTSCIEEARK